MSKPAEMAKGEKMQVNGAEQVQKIRRILRLDLPPVVALIAIAVIVEPHLPIDLISLPKG